jgi:hypothetical protein
VGGGDAFGAQVVDKAAGEEAGRPDPEGCMDVVRGGHSEQEDKKSIGIAVVGFDVWVTNCCNMRRYFIRALPQDRSWDGDYLPAKAITSCLPCILSILS